ncbi:MAG: hypothetical protein HZB13_13080 [Acidobacteria bacterium]|nr:hypothetical protein [Acidobacteriota bacterium]
MQQNLKPREGAAQEPGGGDSGEAMLWCPVCSQHLQQHKCKLICERCGYYMSCADYY